MKNLINNNNNVLGFFKSKSRLGRITTGDIHECEQLTNFVIDSSSSSISLHSLMRNVDHGSNRQDFVCVFFIFLTTASSEIRVKAVIFGQKEDEHSFQCQRGQKYL